MTLSIGCSQMTFNFRLILRRVNSLGEGLRWLQSFIGQSFIDFRLIHKERQYIFNEFSYQVFTPYEISHQMGGEHESRIDLSIAPTAGKQNRRAVVRRPVS